MNFSLFLLFGELKKTFNIKLLIVFLDWLWYIQHCLIFVVLQSNKIPFSSPLTSFDLMPLLTKTLELFDDEMWVRNVVILVLL